MLLAEHKLAGDECAVKFVKKTEGDNDDEFEHAAMVERRVLELGGKSPFLTRLFASFQTPECICFVMECLTGGDLTHHVQDEDLLEGAGFGEPRTRLHVAEIATAVWFLHEHGIIYRDLKLDDVMLDGAGHVKLTDFGLCKEDLAYDKRTDTIVGTPGHLAPEIVGLMSGQSCDPHGFEVDWWSLGVLTHEMLFEDSPFDGDAQAELFEDILNKEPIVEDYDHVNVSNDARSFVKSLLMRKPEDRLGFGTAGKGMIQAHPFFKSLDWARVAARSHSCGFIPNGGDSFTNFDSEFVDQNAKVSPSDARGHIDGFSFVRKILAWYTATLLLCPKIANARVVAGGCARIQHKTTSNRMDFKAAQPHTVGTTRVPRPAALSPSPQRTNGAAYTRARTRPPRHCTTWPVPTLPASQTSPRHQPMTTVCMTTMTHALALRMMQSTRP